jgi:hypothetical protein
MKNIIKKWLGVDKLIAEISLLKIQNAGLSNQLDKTHSLMKEFTRVDADIGFRGNNTIILTGVFKGRGYVQFYDLGDGEFRDMVERLRDMKKYALIRQVDAPPNRDFKGTFGI